MHWETKKQTHPIEIIALIHWSGAKPIMSLRCARISLYMAKTTELQKVSHIGDQWYHPLVVKLERWLGG